MRVRSLVVMSVLLPAALSAQRRGGTRIGGGRVAPPAALPPQAPVVAKEMSYVRLPISAESYTFISYNQSPTATKAFAAWGNLAAGTKFSLKMNSAFSATADLTQSLLFGPMSVTTFELGTRFHPRGDAIDPKMRLFADARIGYTSSRETYAFQADPTAVTPVQFLGSRYGNGVGAIAGMGSDYRITRTMYLATGFWGTRSRLRSMSTNPFRPASSGQYYHMTTYRLALGLKWNPVRSIYEDPQSR